MASKASPASRRKAGAKKAPTRSKATTSSARSAAFVCPECGRRFGRAAALGAHRRSHGVAGTSRTSSGSQATGARRAARGTARSAQVDRDALLRLVFPTGLPASSAVITALASWLEEAERLSKLR